VLSPVMVRYLIAAAFLAVATAVRLALDPVLGEHVPYVTYFVAVGAVSYFCGLGPAIFATLAGSYVAELLFHPPRYHLFPYDGSALSLFGTVSYFVVTGMTILLAEAVRTAQNRAAINDRRGAKTIENITDGFFAFDSQWRFTYVNHQAERICDMKRVEMIGRTIWEVFPPLRGTHLEGAYLRAMRERVAIELENFWEPWQRWFLIRVNPAEEGGLSVFFQDITKRKTAEDQVRLGAELLTFLIDRSPSGFYIVDADFRISHINADSQARAFRNVNPAIGRRLDDAMRVLWPEPLATEIIDIFSHTLDTGEPYKSPGLVSTRADLGGEETYEWQLQRIIMPDGRYAVVCYFYDTTDLREAEREVRRALEKVEQASRMKDEFLATLSHELRTPMSAILGWSQMLHRGSNPESIEQGIEVIERNARLQAQIIEDLLDMNRIIAGKLRLEIQSMQIGKVVEAAVESTDPSAQAKNLKLEIVCEPGLPLMRADPSRLQQVFFNLLSNAVKFTPPYGTIRVTCRALSQESQIEIAVADTGKGIAPEFMPFVFERFRQQDASTTREFGGLGLGLSVVKYIVEAHGGTIRAASEGEGKGATFAVRLPVAVALKPEVPKELSVVRSMLDVRDPEVFDASALQGRTILIVDDERDARELIATVLEKRGVNCLVAASGEEAVSLFRAGTRPDLIVSDLAMPGMNGYDLMAQVRSMPPEKGGATPGIALTAFARPEDRNQSLRAGYQLHLSKPVEINELLGSIMSLLN
jgi:PAS domain S-box-containing protein